MDDGALTGLDLIALRRAAAMTHTVGGLSLRLRSGEHVLATVVSAGATGPVPHPHPAGTVFDSCGFRMAVAKAWFDHRAGQRVAFAGAEVTDLAVDWAIQPPGLLLGFGGVRAHVAGRMVWALPSLLPPVELREVFAGLSDGAADPPAILDAITARLVHDDLLDVCVVHLEVDSPRPGTVRRLAALLDEVTYRLIAASAAAEVVESVNAEA